MLYADWSSAHVLRVFNCHVVLIVIVTSVVVIVINFQVDNNLRYLTFMLDVTRR